MRWRPQTWFLLSVMFLLAGGYVWWLADEWEAKKATASSAQPKPPSGPAKIAPSRSSKSSRPAPPRLLSRPEMFASATSNSPASTRSPRFSHRLSNTTKTVGELARSDKAILLENALIDTEQPVALPIPERLRAQGDPGSYVVQSRGPLDDAFRALLQEAGASIVSYIPQNAYLVRVSAAGAQRLAAQPQTQTVLPYEPYYKLKPALLKLAVEQKPLPEDSALNLLLFPGEREAMLEELQKLGAKVVSEDRSPFGPVVTVQPPVDALTALAGLRGVQGIEMFQRRVAANDLSRVRVGVSTNTLVPDTDNYLGLRGNNIVVNVNDSGVDASHPDLVGVMGDLPGSLVDFDGHGTHVAGTIASSGGQSTTVSNASGSINPGTGTQYRGIASQAKIFSMALDLSGVRFGGDLTGLGSKSDTYLQETAARTNAFISNNSWHYQGGNDYDLASASYDAAVRDALPTVPGSQPVLYVFGAGNNGQGDDSGQNGESDTVFSPGNAKNVITVGTAEQSRRVTNDVVKCTTINGVTTCVTNKPWIGSTDSSNQVAGFSGRGNVGIGFEGDAGRFKPDVVAPGTFVVSTRSAQWDQAAYYNPTNFHYDFIPDVFVQTNSLWINTIFVPDNAVQVIITVFADVDLPIYVRQAGLPTTNVFDFVRTNRVSMPPDGGNLSPRGVEWAYGVGNSTTQGITFSVETLLITTNDNGNYFEVLSNLNNQLGPYYRYESGSSMSAAGVSGTLALMQEFFETKLGLMNHSPALMKALLINGARSLGNLYNFQVDTDKNYQGWGLIRLPNSLPASLATNLQSAPLKFFDQDPPNALATGQSQTRTVSLAASARNRPMRVTLVWTDPPGNPAAGIKLVNDLDLIVTNVQTGEVFFGNDIQASRDFNSPWDTNGPPNLDVVNNVENVYLNSPLGSNYTVTVVGRRVNVNAVTAHPNDVAQDYALVISSGEGQVANALTVPDPNPPVVSATSYNVTFLTNGFPSSPGTSGQILFDQRVGANTPLLGTTNGITNQWNFYVVTNGTSFTNAAFVTFLPPTLSIPRIGVREDDIDNATRIQADIDLYVSINPALTNLDPVVIANADRSRRRGGTEVIAYTNSTPGTVYYVGVKSEDRQAAQYNFLGVISEQPFGQRDSEGNLILRGFPVPAVIPDGTPASPGKVFIFGIATEPILVRRVVVTNTITHELFGDLLGNLSHDEKFAVLNNHTSDINAVTNQAFIYEDNDQGDIGGSRRSDGPGNLRTFVGEEGLGLWLLTMEDSASAATGRVDSAFFRLEPQTQTNGLVVAVQPGRFVYTFVDVPTAATNLTICISDGSTAQIAPLELYVRRGDFPTRTLFDKMLNLPAGGGCLTLDKTDTPPLAGGRYFIGVFNPNATAQIVRILVTVGLDLSGVVPVTFGTGGSAPILDDAVTTSSLFVTNDDQIVSVDVGLRIDHPRVSDLAVTLISPRGTRVLLSENRGGTSTGGFGFDISTTNVVTADALTNTTAAATNVIMTGQNAGIVRVDYEFYNIPDTLHLYYDGALIFDSGYVSGSGVFNIPYGPGTATDVTIIVNEGGNTNTCTTNGCTSWQYTATVISVSRHYATFTENTNFTDRPIKFAPPPFSVPNYTGTNPAFSSGIYFLPEQSLNALKGENALGTWQLEIWDNRVGASTGVEFLSWQLQFIFDNAVAPPIKLTHGTPSTNTVPGNSIAYFIVDVPDWANFATNTLTSFSLPLSLLFNQTTPPTTGTAPDFTLLTPTTGGSVTLDTNGVPPLPKLLPGQRYYLGVQNTNTNSVTFVLEVNFDVTTLFNNVPLTNTLAATPLQRYYQFDVSTNATAVIFEILNPDGNVELVTRKGMPFPTLTSFDYISKNPGTNNESITIITNSLPVALTPGRWFLGVFNVDVAAVTYTIVARELANALPNIITLTNAIPYFNTNGGGSNNIDYYRFVVSSNSVRAQFEINNPDADVTLVVRKGLSLPDLAGFDYISANGGTNDELIVVFDFSSPVSLTRGDWFLSAVNVSGGPVNYAIKATEYPVYGTNIVVTSFISSNAFCLTWNSLIGVHYYVQGTPDLDMPVWTTISPTITATSTQTTFCVALPSPYHFFRVLEGLVLTPFIPPGVITLTNGIPYFNTNAAGSNNIDFYRYVVTTNAVRAQFEINAPTGDMTLVARKGLPLPDLASYDLISTNGGTNDELIVLFDFSSPVALTPGDWFISAVNISGGPVSYAVKATEYPVYGTNITVTSFISSNAFCLTWNSLIGVHYYVEGKPDLNTTNWTIVSPTITATSTQTTFCVTLPSPYHFFRVVEGLVVSPTIPLGVITLTNGIPYFNTNAAGSNNIDYYRYVVTTNAVRAQFEINAPTGDMTLVARKGLPLPDLASYDLISANGGTNDELIVLFDYSSPVALSPGDWFISAVNVSGGPVSYSIKATEYPVYGTNIVVTSVISSNAFCLTWNSLIGVHYYVEGKPDLNTTNWTTISPTITATSTQTTFCVMLPSPHQFFRVLEGLAPTVTPAAPAPITIISQQIVSNSFCITWLSLIGTNYVVEGKPDLNVTNWTDVSPTITATTAQTTYCVALPSPYQFFRVRAGNALPVVSPISFSGVAAVTNGVALTWNAATNQQFQVQWTTSLAPATWNTFTNILTSLTGVFTFTDDGSQTSGLSSPRFYRLLQLP